MEERRIRAQAPADRGAAVVAVVGAIDRLPGVGDEAPPTDVVSGRRLANPGGGTALRLLFESDHGQTGSGSMSPAEVDVWGDEVLAACGRLADAKMVLRHVETGTMRAAERAGGELDVWVAATRPPAAWVDRSDVDRWAASLARRHGDELRAARAAVDGGGDDYDRLAAVHLKRMAYQVGLPDDAMIDGCSVRTYRLVLGRLLAWALRADGRGESSMQSERGLAAAVAAALRLAPTVAARAVAAYIVDEVNASYHAAVPGAAAPVVRVGVDRLVCSIHGLTTEPLLSLTRELRRRAADEYHNATHLKEGVFRRDVYGLFSDKRFVAAAGGIALRRERGDLRTDIDAAVFDRKTGTLAVFELKSLDPFARSAAELARQRDTVLYANRQVSGVLEWLQRHGPDEILDRVDHATAKRFRVQKVLPFVLARYLVRFEDGPEPDRRAAWGTWPQVLRLLGGEPARTSDANPLASLHARLKSDDPGMGSMPDSAREIELGDMRLVVHPSYAEYRASVGGTAMVG